MARAQMTDITVDATAPGSAVQPIWAFHGYDECNYTTTADGRAVLQTLGMIPPVPPHIRTHFLLNTGDGVASPKWGSTDVYTVDAAGNPVYDWTLMDSIMDTITGAGGLPYVEIGFMPEALSTHPSPYQNSSATALNGGCFYPPADYTKWAALISAWAAHENARYAGVESTWQWELWNEPDLAYWKGTPAEYDELYDYTESALHGVLADAPLGGPATAGTGPFFTQFLQHCANGANAVTGATGTRLDLVSFHAKGGVGTLDGNVEMDLGNQLSLHNEGFNSVAAFPQYKQTPIVISEADPEGCGSCIEALPTYRTSPAYGAYEVVMMKRTLELAANVGVNVRGVLAWAFVVENAPLFAAYRVLASNGIDLPVLNAFKLLGALRGDAIPVTSSGALPLASILANGVRAQPDIDAMAARDGAKVSVLVWNYHDVLETVPPAPVSLSIKVPPSFGARAIVSHMRVDEAHGDAYTVWLSQGSPPTPTPAQLSALEQAMVPSRLQPDETVPVMSGAVNIAFDLPRFGLSLVSVSAGDTLDAPEGGAASASMQGSAGGTAGCGCAVGDKGRHAQGLLAWFPLTALLVLRLHSRKKTHRGSPRAVALCAVVGAFAMPSSARASDPFEIQVYDGTADPPGVPGIELHLNYWATGNREATPPEAPLHGQFHATLEPSLGITPFWELGAYVQSAVRTDDGVVDWAGVKLRSKFVTPPWFDPHWRLGVNVELSYLPVAYDADRWGSEIRPIVAWHDERWLFVINPILDQALAGSDASQGPWFEPAAKVARTVGPVAVGFEYYSTLGPLTAILPWAQQQEQVFEVLDVVAIERFELNIGVGEGLTQSSAGIVFKMIVGWEFDREVDEGSPEARCRLPR